METTLDSLLAGEKRWKNDLADYWGGIWQVVGEKTVGVYTVILEQYKYLQASIESVKTTVTGHHSWIQRIDRDLKTLQAEVEALKPKPTVPADPPSDEAPVKKSNKKSPQ